MTARRQDIAAAEAARSLAEKVAAFAASLSTDERDLFEYVLRQALRGESDVSGYLWEPRVLGSLLMGAAEAAGGTAADRPASGA